MQEIIIETKRLILNEFTSDDSKFILELLNSPGWLKHIGNRGIHSIQDAEKYISDKIAVSYNKNGYGFYKIILKSSREKAGMCGLIKRDTLDDIDIGFALLPQFEGNGYAFEASEAVMDYAKYHLKINRIAAITVTYNTTSIKLLDKLGMKFEKTIQLPGDPEELMLYYKDLSN